MCSQAQQTGRVQPGPEPETGSLEQQGSYEYEGEDGITYKIEYIANEGGFQATGDHVPTPPPQIAEYAELRRDFPELFWATDGGAGTNQQKFGHQGEQFF